MNKLKEAITRIKRIHRNIFISALIVFFICAAIILGYSSTTSKLENYVMADYQTILKDFGEPVNIKARDGIVIWDLGSTAISFNQDGRVVNILTTSTKISTIKDTKVGDSVAAVYKAYGWPDSTITNSATLKDSAYLRLNYKKNTFHISENMKVLAMEAHIEK